MLRLAAVSVLSLRARGAGADAGAPGADRSASGDAPSSPSPGATAPPAQPATGRACGDALDCLLDRRRMVRRFTADPVDDATLGRLIDAATRAPSAGNRQPWGFVAVRDASRRTALARAALGQTFVAEAPLVVVACADPDRARERYGERAERYATIDTAFASLLLLLAVVEEGLGACFVGAFDDAEVARLVALPPSVRPLAVIPIGHPAEEPPPMRRRGAGEILHRETWAPAGP